MGSKRYSDDPGFGEFCRGNSSAGRTCGRSRIVAQAVIDICRQLGASVQAAGVETQDQFNVLREIGCDYAQGTLFNKPITIETFEVRYLRDR